MKSRIGFMLKMLLATLMGMFEEATNSWMMVNAPAIDLWINTLKAD